MIIEVVSVEIIMTHIDWMLYLCLRIRLLFPLYQGMLRCHSLIHISQMDSNSSSSNIPHLFKISSSNLIDLMDSITSKHSQDLLHSQCNSSSLYRTSRCLSSSVSSRIVSNSMSSSVSNVSIRNLMDITPHQIVHRMVKTKGEYTQTNEIKSREVVDLLCIV